MTEQLSMHTPRTNPRLIGHHAAAEYFLQHLRTHTLPHAWILAGGRGTGKATLAYHFARCLLAGQEGLAMDEAHPVFRRVAAGSHADLLVLEPEFDEKKEEQKREISVENARGIAEFLAKTAGEGAWRVVIIDSADELNTNAANAILKILEEPPPRTVLFLTSHNPGKLLPTIRSRCRLLALPPLNPEEYRQVMRLSAPELDGDTISRLGALTRYSPGLALEWQEKDALMQYDRLVALFAQLPMLPASAIQQFADLFTAKQMHTLWRMTGRLLSCFLERLVTNAPDRTEQEAQCHARLLQLRPPGYWADSWSRTQQEFSLAERLHLDYKTVIISYFEQLRSEASLPAHAG